MCPLKYLQILKYCNPIDVCGPSIDDEFEIYFPRADINECMTGNYTCPGGKCKNKEGGSECTPNIRLLVVILGNLLIVKF